MNPPRRQGRSLVILGAALVFATVTAGCSSDAPTPARPSQTTPAPTSQSASPPGTSPSSAATTGEEAQPSGTVPPTTDPSTSGQRPSSDPELPRSKRSSYRSVAYAFVRSLYSIDTRPPVSDRRLADAAKRAAVYTQEPLKSQIAVPGRAGADPLVASLLKHKGYSIAKAGPGDDGAPPTSSTTATLGVYVTISGRGPHWSDPDLGWSQLVVTCKSHSGRWFVSDYSITDTSA